MMYWNSSSLYVCEFDQLCTSATVIYSFKKSCHIQYLRNVFIFLLITELGFPRCQATPASFQLHDGAHRGNLNALKLMLAKNEVVVDSAALVNLKPIKINILRRNIFTTSEIF